MVRSRPLPFQDGGKSAAASAVRIVLLDGGVEVAIRSHGVAGKPERSLAAPVSKRKKTGAIPEAAVLYRSGSVQTRMHILIARGLDDATELQTKFGRVSRGAHVQRIELIDVERLRKSRGPIVIERHAIDDVLDVVLRTARMQSAVGLEHPARLRIHKADHRSVGRSPCPVFGRLAWKKIGRASCRERGW